MAKLQNVDIKKGTFIDNFLEGNVAIQIPNVKQIRPLVDALYSHIGDFLIDNMINLDLDDCADYYGDYDHDDVVDAIADHMEYEWRKYKSDTAYRISPKNYDLVYKNVDSHIKNKRDVVTANMVIAAFTQTCDNKTVNPTPAQNDTTTKTIVNASIAALKAAVDALMDLNK